jgi:hypothetical protein
MLTLFLSRWNANLNIMRGSCDMFKTPRNSEQEMIDLRKAIIEAGKSSAVDVRFILAIVLQESGGCVRAPTTASPDDLIRNPGLMQDHNGDGTCNDSKRGGVKNPCPQDQITQMITDGVLGTKTGDGLKQTLQQARGEGAQKFYQAARIYNSGSIDAGGKLEAGVATHCYASDVANRLTGWTTVPRGCDLS